MDAQQVAMFPDDVPEPVVRYWEAKKRWYASGTHDLPTREEFVKKVEPEISTRTLDRWRRAYRALLGAWPPRRADRPPWQAPSSDGLVGTQQLNVVPDEVHKLRRVRTTGFDEDGRPVAMVQLYDTVTGALVRSYIDAALGALAAGIFGYAMLDMISDGKFDGLVRLLQFAGCHWRA